MMTTTEAAVGRVLNTLTELNRAEDTVVLFTSDPGEGMGVVGIRLKGSLHYQGLRVPLIWSDSGASQGVDGLASTIDIPATILGCAGLAPNNGVQGSSLLDMCATAGRTGLLIEEDALRPNFGYEERPRVRTLVTERYRLSIWSDSEWGELYDLADDPHELTNLWDEAGAATLKADLIEQLVQLMVTMQIRSPLLSGLA